MKITLSTYQIAGALMQDENAKWSRAAAFTLAEYLQEVEEAAGEEQELDVVEIRCHFSEYSSATEAAEAYGWSADPDEFDNANESAALAWLQDRTSAIEFDGGIIIEQF